jgi:hypothetical protein
LFVAATTSALTNAYLSEMLSSIGTKFFFWYCLAPGPKASAISPVS